MVESYHEGIGGFCVSWPTKMGKVTGESAAHMRQSQRDGGDHFVYHFEGTRNHGSVHFMKYAAWIYCTKWKQQLLPTADSKAPWPMKLDD